MIRRWFLCLPLLILLSGLVLGCSSDEPASTDEIAAIPVKVDELAQYDDSTAEGRSANQASNATFDVVLARSISESRVAEEATRSFFEDFTNLFLMIEHQQDTPAPLTVRWYALDTNGSESELESS